MKTIIPSHAEYELSQLANRFTHWRQNRPTRRARIPQPLWDQAVSLTQSLPISHVAKRLGLCATDLKRHCSANAGVAHEASFSSALRFVEITETSAWLPASAEVELQRSDGTRMRIEYHDPQPSLTALVQTFLETP